jgi:hypothetical protein
MRSCTSLGRSNRGATSRPCRRSTWTAAGASSRQPPRPACERSCTPRRSVPTGLGCSSAAAASVGGRRAARAARRPAPRRRHRHAAAGARRRRARAAARVRQRGRRAPGLVAAPSPASAAAARRAVAAAHEPLLCLAHQAAALAAAGELGDSLHERWHGQRLPGERRCMRDPRITCGWRLAARGVSASGRCVRRSRSPARPPRAPSCVPCASARRSARRRDGHRRRRSAR